MAGELEALADDRVILAQDADPAARSASSPPTSTA
jgi:hypothetical protein